MFELSFLVHPTPNQKKQILDIYHSQGWWPKETNNPERISQILKSSHCFVLATSDKEVAGIGRALSDKTGDAYIHDVTVKKKFRKQGLGRKIVKKLIDRLKSDGLTWVALIAENNSHPFYEKEGFKIMEHSVPMFRKL